jgi:hypothetical protein
MNRFLAAPIVALVLVASPRIAFADKIAVLSFTSAGPAKATDLDDARVATRAAVTRRSHTQPSDSELLTAQMSTRDGVADTRNEYRSAGRASGSAWTIQGHVEGHGDTYRLELEVCQVETGRVESLVREIAPSVASPQIGEMLDYLVRPEGIGNIEIVWKVVAPPSITKGPVVATATVTATAPPAVRHAFAESAPFGLGVGVDALAAPEPRALLGALAALVRPSNARGSGAALGVHAAVTYAFAQAPGLDLRADLGVVVAGPSAFHATIGARYMLPLAATARVFVGPEVGLGGFFTLGAEKTARGLVHGAAVAAIGVGARAQLEIAGELDYAGGGSGSLVLGGASARALVRF